MEDGRPMMPAATVAMNGITTTPAMQIALRQQAVICRMNGKQRAAVMPRLRRQRVVGPLMLLMLRLSRQRLPVLQEKARDPSQAGEWDMLQDEGTIPRVVVIIALVLLSGCK